MNFTTNRDHLSAALRKCAEMAHKQTLPILGCVLLRVHGDTLTLSATNLDMGIECSVEVEAGKDGAICLPAKHLLSVVENCRELEVVVEVKGLQAVITSGKSRFKVVGLEAGEFPAPVETTGEKVKVLEQHLSRLLKSVKDCCADETDSRIILRGVYFNFRQDSLTLCATNGRSLAEATADAKADEGVCFVLPDMAIQHLAKALGFDQEATICCDGRIASFECSLGRLWSKVVEGTYPNYKQVIPKYETTPIKIERELLKECVERGSLASFVAEKYVNGKEYFGSVALRFSNNELECTAQSPERGESADSIVIDYAGPEVTVSFNPDYLLHILAGLTDDLVGIAFKDERSPLLVTGIAFLAVIMPQRPKA